MNFFLNLQLRILPRQTAIFLLLTILPGRVNPQLADGNAKYLGNVISSGYSIPGNFDIYWNQVTPENSGKWGSVESSRDNMQWGSLDLIYQYAKDKGFPFRQHNFVWGQQQPGWMSSLSQEEQKEEVEEWIRLYGERFPDTDFIDVVNEPFNAPPAYREALGGRGVTGWDWVIWVFEKARQYNPNAKLHLNEYNVLGSNTTTASYINLINLLKERNLIDGIGEQGHFMESTPIKTISSNLNLLAATGLPVYITEYDVRIADDNAQLAKYQEQFPVIWENPGIRGVTLWGYMEGRIWRTEAYLLRSDGSERPAMEWLRDYIAQNTSSVDPVSLSHSFELFQNYPNPFNPETQIRYRLHDASHVKLIIYDVMGRKVKTLVDWSQSAGFYSISWNAADEAGRRVSGGVYLCRIMSTSVQGVISLSKKMLLLN